MIHAPFIESQGSNYRQHFLIRLYVGTCHDNRFGQSLDQVAFVARQPHMRAEGQAPIEFLNMLFQLRHFERLNVFTNICHWHEIHRPAPWRCHAPRRIFSLHSVHHVDGIVPRDIYGVDPRRWSRRSKAARPAHGWRWLRFSSHSCSRSKSTDRSPSWNWR